MSLHSGEALRHAAGKRRSSFDVVACQIAMVFVLPSILVACAVSALFLAEVGVVAWVGAAPGSPIGPNELAMPLRTSLPLAALALASTLALLAFRRRLLHRLAGSGSTDFQRKVVVP